MASLDLVKAVVTEEDEFDTNGVEIGTSEADDVQVEVDKLTQPPMGMAKDIAWSRTWSNIIKILNDRFDARNNLFSD